MTRNASTAFNDSVTAFYSTLIKQPATVRAVFKPKFTLTPAIAKALMEVEAARQAVVELPINVEACGTAPSWQRPITPRR